MTTHEKRTFNSNAPQNPVGLLEEKDDRAISKSLIGNLELDYKFHFLPDLHAHVNGGMDLSMGKQYTDVSPYSSTNNYYGSYGWEQKDKYNLSLNAYLQYSKDFTDKHRFDVMAGMNGSTSMIRPTRNIGDSIRCRTTW